LFMRMAALEFGALPTAAVRVAIASAFLWPLLHWRGHSPALKQHWRPIFAVGLLNSGVPFACYSYALLYISTGLSSILNATVPLFGALVAWIWLKDRPNALRMAGLAIGFAGVAMLATGKASFKPDASGMASGWAVVACLVATLCYGIAASFTRKYLSGMSPLVTATGSQMGATLGLVVPAVWLWPQTAPGVQAWLALAVLGVLCTGVAYILYFRLIENAGPAKALSVTFLVPVFAIVYGAMLLGEAVTTWMLVCGGVIFVGTALSTGLIKTSK
jgi:drug/metabolite transporter (DMT)-like permease